MASTPTTGRARSWCFTVNNPTSKIDFASFGCVVYGIYQLEIAPNSINHTPHYQGYVQFNGLLRFSMVRSYLPGAHLIVARGTPLENKEYCSKLDSRAPGDSGPWEYGNVEDCSTKGKRNDWHDIKDMCKEMAPDIEIAEIYPRQFATCKSGIKDLKNLYILPRSAHPIVHVIIGPTETGKTHYVNNLHANVYAKPTNSKWWDFYDGQRIILIDEFNGWLPFNTLITLCDKYPQFQVEFKGGAMLCPAEEIFIVSNYRPKEWYGPELYLPAFIRRVTKWSFFATRDEHVDFPGGQTGYAELLAFADSKNYRLDPVPGIVSDTVVQVTNFVPPPAPPPPPPAPRFKILTAYRDVNQSTATPKVAKLTPKKIKWSHSKKRKLCD